MPWPCEPILSDMPIRLEPRGPFRLDLTVWALHRQPGNRIDLWDGQTYRRCLVIGDSVLLVEVRQEGEDDAPRLAVRLQGAGSDRPGVRAAAAAQLVRILGLDVDLSGFYARAARDPLLAPLARRYRGLKPPRFPSLFEALANAIACQQVSLAAGIALLGRLAQAFGAAPAQAPTLHAFAQPAALRAIDPAALHALGWSRQKAQYLLDVAARLDAGELPEAQLEQAGDAELLRQLCTLRGIKRWSSQYVALRGMGRLGVFPVDDVGAHKHLTAWLDLPARLDAASTEALVSRWQPDAGLVYFHLLLRRLEAQGQIRAGDVTSAAQPFEEPLASSDSRNPEVMP